MILLALLVGWSGLVGPPAARIPESMAHHRAGQCLLAINGRDVHEFADADDALRLNVDDVVQIDALSEEPSSVTHISVDLPIGPSVEIKTLRHQLDQRFSEALRISDISDIGVGWYHIEVKSGSCSEAFWVRVYGRSPLTTIIGIGAALVVVLGLALVGVAVLRARHNQPSLWWGVGAGLLTGLGLCVLAQQFSVVAFTPVALAVFLGGGAAVGAGSTAVAGTAGGAATTATPPLDPSPPPAPTPSAPPSSSPAPPPPPAGSAPPSPAPAPSAPPSPGGSAPPPSPSHTLPPPVGATDDEAAIDPPRRSFARIECDDAVVASTAFDLTVGLSPTPVIGVVGPALVRPPSSVGDYELVAHVVADGFELAEGETWRKTMLVSVQEPYPRRRVQTHRAAGSGS